MWSILEVASFLADYGTATRNSYATDLRLFADWCRDYGLNLFEVQRSHLELFGRSMEARGLMASTVARRLSALASFYRYCAGVALRDVQDAASHSDPRTTMRYDRARHSLDRHATYVVATFHRRRPLTISPQHIIEWSFPSGPSAAKRRFISAAVCCYGR